MPLIFHWFSGFFEQFLSSHQKLTFLFTIWGGLSWHARPCMKMTRRKSLRWRNDSLRWMKLDLLLPLFFRFRIHSPTVHDNHNAGRRCVWKLTFHFWSAQECWQAWGQAWGKYVTFPVGRFWLVISAYWSSDIISRKCWSNCFQTNTNPGVRLLFGCFIGGCYSSRNFVASPPLVLLQNSNSWLVHYAMDVSVDWFQES